MSASACLDACEPAAPEIQELETHLQCRLNGRVLGLRLLASKVGLVLQGTSHTYYAKQLAQHAVMAATPMPLLANEIQVR
jgi:hypothetical protein